MKTLLLALFGVVLGLWSMELSGVNGIKIRWGNWGEWTKCDATCGGGVKSKMKRCTTPGISGDECIKRRQKKCNMQPCLVPDFSPFGEPPVNPERMPVAAHTSSFGEPTSAPESKPKKGYTIPFGEPTPGPEPEPWTGKRLTKDSEMKEWGQWSACDVLCDGGMRYRTRECVHFSGKSDCEDAQSEACNTFPCWGFDRPSPGYPEAEPTHKSLRPWINDASPEGEPTRSSGVTKTTSRSNTGNVTVNTPSTVSYTTTISDKELRKRKREMKKICGSSKIRASKYVIRTAISPSYPKSYSGNLDCIWTLISPKRTRVRIEVEDFTMSEGDKLMLIEGRYGDKTYSDNNIIATLHGNISNGTEYRSIGRFMTLRLRTKSFNGGGRYSFKFGTTTAEHDEEVKNSETAPDVETWVKIMRILMKHFSNKF